MEKLGCTIIWKQSSFVIKFPDPLERNQQFTLFFITKHDNVNFNWLKEQLSRLNYPKEIYKEYSQKALEIFNLTDLTSIDEAQNTISLKDFKNKYSRILPVIKSTINKIKKEASSIKVPEEKEMTVEKLLQHMPGEHHSIFKESLKRWKNNKNLSLHWTKAFLYVKININGKPQKLLGFDMYGPSLISLSTMHFTTRHNLQKAKGRELQTTSL